MPNPIKPREKAVIVNALSGGVVPSIGLQHIQVGRKDEIAALIRDLEQMKQGIARIRVIVGDFGSGKSFFLNVAKTLAHVQGFVVASADMTTDRALYASDGKARALYSELMNNLSLHTRPDGGALKTIVEKWLTSFGMSERTAMERTLDTLRPLEKYVSGVDFATVLSMYREAYDNGNDIRMAQCLKWLKAEYETRTAARADLGVRTIIDDDNFYDYLKLFSEFVRLAGYSGLLVNLDEMVVLTRLRKPVRDKNYEKLLSIYNDCLQGSCGGFGFLVSGTPDFVEDEYRGLASYGALATRLAPSRLETAEARDFSGPLIRLDVLTREELVMVFMRIREVFALKDPGAYLIDDEGIMEYLKWTLGRLGADAFLQPREAIQGFVKLLSQIEGNPGKAWRDFLSTKPAEDQTAPQSSLAKLRL